MIPLEPNAASQTQLQSSLFEPPPNHSTGAFATAKIRLGTSNQTQTRKTDMHNLDPDKTVEIKEKDGVKYIYQPSSK